MLAGLGGQDTPCFYLPKHWDNAHALHSLTSSVSIKDQTQILCLWKYFTHWVIVPVSYNPFWLGKKRTQSSARHLPLCGYITFPQLTLGSSLGKPKVVGIVMNSLVECIAIFCPPPAASRSSVNSPEPDGHQIAQVSSGKINLWIRLFFISVPSLNCVWTLHGM